MKKFFKRNKSAIKGIALLAANVGLIFWELIDAENGKIITNLDAAILGGGFIASLIIIYEGLKADALR